MHGGLYRDLNGLWYFKTPNFIEMTSNMIYIVAPDGAFKCAPDGGFKRPLKIH